MKTRVKYDDLLDITKIYNAYHTIKLNSKHKEKITKYELNLTANLVYILDVLRKKEYKHTKYNIFVISEPKHRVIMSECMYDKIVNHLVSSVILNPIVNKVILDVNVATRVDKGSKAGIYYVKKFINHLKINNDKIYILKCDISKYFYSIDHEILMEKLGKLIKDKDVMSLIWEIISSTNEDYINNNIISEINHTKRRTLNNSKIHKKEKEYIFKALDKLPLYSKNKGLPIGNMTSQILAIFYLNDLDHFIKEKLKIKCYIRYMDDFILMHPDKEYLEYCLGEIKKEIEKLKLTLNKKTQITEIHDGLSFLGYKFILKGKRLHVLIDGKGKRRLNKALKNVPDKDKYNYIYHRYKGYLIYTTNHEFIYQYEKLCESKDGVVT